MSGEIGTLELHINSRVSKHFPLLTFTVGHQAKRRQKVYEKCEKMQTATLPPLPV